MRLQNIGQEELRIFYVPHMELLLYWNSEKFPIKGNEIVN